MRWTLRGNRNDYTWHLDVIARHWPDFTSYEESYWNTAMGPQWLTNLWKVVNRKYDYKSMEQVGKIE